MWLSKNPIPHRRCWTYVAKTSRPGTFSFSRPRYLTNGIFPVKPATQAANSSFTDARRAAHAERDLFADFKDLRGVVEGFDPIFLRDSCTCPRCIDPSTSQRLFQTADIPLDVQLKHILSTSTGALEFEWDNDIPGFDGHTSTFSASFFKENRLRIDRVRAAHNLICRTYWDRDLIEKRNRVFAFKEYLDSDGTLHEALQHLLEYGIVFLDGVPSESEAIGLIASRIGPLRNSFYGSTWNVRSLPSAKNVAYTSGDLGFHMDLLYMADPPSIQLLHPLKTSDEGGESMFSDGFKALDTLAKRDLAAATVLSKFLITYRYKNDGQWYEQTRPTVEGQITLTANGITDSDGSITSHKYGEPAINWGPQFQGPLQVDSGSDIDRQNDHGSNLRNYVAAAKLYKALLEEPGAIFETKMKEGTCVIFDNRRVLHARKAFNSQAGERWLRGGYVDRDAFRSRLRVLNE